MHTFIPPVGVTQTQGDARYPRRVSTVAALRALTGTELAGAVATEGYYAAGDGGESFPYDYSSGSTATDDGGRVLKPDTVSGGSAGRWIMRMTGSLSPKQFGAKNDDLSASAATNTTAFTNWAAAIQTTAHNRAHIPPGRYHVTVAIANYMCTISNTSGFVINAHGATLVDTRKVSGYTGTEATGIFWFVTCKNFKLLGLRTESELFTTVANIRGLRTAVLSNTCENFEIDVETDGGLTGVQILQPYTDATTLRSKNGKVVLRSNQTFYPYSATYSGDNIDVKLDTQACGRTFLLINANRHRIDVRAKDVQHPSEIVAQHGLGCSDIDVRWYDHDTTAARASGVNPLGVVFNDETPATLRNIRIGLDTINPSSGGWLATVEIQKINNSLLQDVVGRGHILDGLEIYGVSDQVANNYHIKYGGFGAFAAPDIVRNLRFDKLTTRGAGLISTTLPAVYYGTAPRNQPVANLMADSGRFAGKIAPTVLTFTNAFVNSAYFGAANGTTSGNSGGKFIYDNTTNGGASADNTAGTAGALTADVTALLTAMGRTDSFNKRYGSEFWISTLTAISTLGTSPNNTSPGSFTDAVTRYLISSSGARAILGVGSRATLAFWVRLKTNGAGTTSDKRLGIRPAASMPLLMLDGQETLEILLSVNDGWHFVVMQDTSPNGYSSAFPALYALASDVVQIACPAIFAGDARPTAFTHSIPSMHELITV